MARFVLACCGMVVVLVCGGCAKMTGAASRDPMMCERDPKCAKRDEKSRDCPTVCSYDPACIDRCRQVENDPWRR